MSSVLHDPFSFTREEAQKAGQLHSSRLHRERSTGPAAVADTQRHDRSGHAECVGVRVCDEPSFTDFS